MDAKQIRLENLVVSYFKQRTDTSVRSITGGRYKVKLMSDVAQTDFGRGLSDELMLVFTTEDAYNYKDAELITTNHPLLDIIRNDLEKYEDQDPRVSEAYFPIQLVDSGNQISIPKLQLLNLGKHEIGLNVSFEPYYVFTYKVIYEMDGGSEDIVKIIISGKTGEETNDLLSMIDEDLLISGPPDIKKMVKNELTLKQVQAISRDVIFQRVLSDLQSIAESVDAQIDSETRRITDFYANELNKLEKNVVRGLTIVELEKARQRELQEWKDKLAYTVKIQPLSILRLWFPTLDYELTLRTARDTYIIDKIAYSFELDKTLFHECKRCGNDTEFCLCLSGKHVTCAGQCQESVKICKVCNDDFCAKHGKDCDACNTPVCMKDGRKCSYGMHLHDERFCPDCITDSFERKNLCLECREKCDVCERNFPHELMSNCRIGLERICCDHEKKPDGFKCVECGEYSCSQHGSVTEDQEWACSDHQLLSTCCGKSYRISSLDVCCCDSKEYICRNHSVKCYECGESVCENHKYPLKDHRGKYVCANCRKTCAECSTDRSYLASDLHQCSQCRKKVCKTHQNICVVGSETLCSKHVNVSLRGEIVCELHAGYCIETGVGKDSPIFRTDQLLNCVVCKQTVCSDHGSKCKVCKSTTICNAHIESQPRCPSCGHWSCNQNGCSVSAGKCKDCGMAYCKNCITEKGICKACAGLELLRNPAQWLAYLRTLPSSIGGENARILNEMLLSSNKLKIWGGVNKSYSVLVVRYSPGIIESLWKNSEQLRIVITKPEGKFVKSRREKVTS